MKMNLVCSTKHCHQHFCISEVSAVQVKNTAECGWHGWLRLTPLVRRSQCLWLENLPVQDASSMFVTSLADIDLKRKHGWMGSFLRNGCTSSIVSWKCKEERLLWQSIITLPIQKFQDWKLSIYIFCHQIPLPGNNLGTSWEQLHLGTTFLSMVHFFLKSSRISWRIWLQLFPGIKRMT